MVLASVVLCFSLCSSVYPSLRFSAGESSCAVLFAVLRSGIRRLLAWLGGVGGGVSWVCAGRCRGRAGRLFYMLFMCVCKRLIARGFAICRVCVVNNGKLGGDCRLIRKSVG